MIARTTMALVQGMTQEALSATLRCEVSESRPSVALKNPKDGLRTIQELKRANFRKTSTSKPQLTTDFRPDSTHLRQVSMKDSNSSATRSMKAMTVNPSLMVAQGTSSRRASPTIATAASMITPVTPASSRTNDPRNKRG